MDKETIEVKFVYENQINQTFKCHLEMKIRQICLEFCAKNEINFNSVKFTLNKKNLENSDFERPINTFEDEISNGYLIIIVNDCPITGEREFLNLNTLTFFFFF